MRVTLAFFFAVVLAFGVGAVTGYGARGLTTSPVATASTRAASPCPPGEHPSVWYSTHAWSCVSDAGSVDTPNPENFQP